MFRRTGELGAAPSISVFEPGFLRTTLALHRAGRVPAGAIVKLYFGGELEFGLPPTAAGLAAYLELLEPSGLPWSVAVLGGDVLDSGLAELRDPPRRPRPGRPGGLRGPGRADQPGAARRSGRAGGAARPDAGHHREARELLGLP